MEKDFESNVRTILRSDIKEFQSLYQNELDEKANSIETKNKELTRQKIELEKAQAEYNGHCKTPKGKEKLEKRAWKAKKKSLMDQVSVIRKIIYSYTDFIENTNVELNDLKQEKFSEIQKMKSEAEAYINEVNVNDAKIINQLEISTLQTKVKVNLKEYTTTKQGRNVRVGMSFGKGFKPRFHLMGSLVNKEKTSLTSNQKFDIRKNDDFGIRVAEIAEFIGVANSKRLENKILDVMKREKGSQYISDFLN